MLARVFLRRLSLASRSRKLPIRGGDHIENAPGNVRKVFAWWALFRK